MHKSHGGAGEKHGTADPRTRTQKPRPNAHRHALTGVLRDDETRGGRKAKRQVGWKMSKDGLTRGSEQYCEGNVNPMSVAGTKIPARSRQQPGVPGTWVKEATHE